VVGARGSGVKYVLLDIEGTTTSISFVHDVLFPFARKATERHVRWVARLYRMAVKIKL
jgi:methionine salvage enolase-phosphatase E1